MAGRRVRPIDLTGVDESPIHKGSVFYYKHFAPTPMQTLTKPCVETRHMPPSLEEDRRREADRLRDDLPPRPITRRDFAVLQADPAYEVYRVRGHYDAAGQKVATQFGVRFSQLHVIAFDYSANAGHWDVVATGEWPADLPAIDRELDYAALPSTDWHVPLTTYRRG